MLQAKVILESLFGRTLQKSWPSRQCWLGVRSKMPSTKKRIQRSDETHASDNRSRHPFPDS